MSTSTKTAITPTRLDDYPQWYQEVIKAADLAEVSPVRGCMVIKPWGYAIWENIQRALDLMFKETGHENAYFPLLIPLSFLEKEAEHVEGFAKECAVVTHHRLEANDEGRLVPSGKLDEPYVIRPTSETIIGSMFSKWVQSYRDLPLLINQWANVVRWELRTRMFLRTTEFLWQEGHTAHATAEEAIEETKRMLGVYARFAEEFMAMPVILGEKPAAERFPGAVSTLCIEAMMQDRKALQAGTSHFLGQNFSRAQEIKFQDQNGVEQFAWTTSWGVSTRLVGALIMTHSDDNGLVLPPRLAPKHVVILPIYRNDDERGQVLSACKSLQDQLQSQSFHGSAVRVAIDDRDVRGGEKNWYHVKRGVPIRVEIGPRDISAGTIVATRRDQPQKTSMPINEFVATVVDQLDDLQSTLFRRALDLREENSRDIHSVDEFRKFFTPKNPEKPELHGGFAWCHVSECPQMHAMLQELKVTVRCVPIDGTESTGRCLFTGADGAPRTLFAKAY